MELAELLYKFDSVNTDPDPGSSTVGNGGSQAE